MEYVSLFLKLLMYMVPMGLLVAFVVFFGTEVYIRKSVRGACLLIFWDEHRDLTYVLVKVDRKATVEIGGKIYTIHPNRQCHVQYPFWAPSFMQEKVDCYNFRPNSYEPFDPLDVDLSKSKQLMTPKMLRDLTDEAMLSATVKDAREAVEGSVNTLGSLPNLILMGLAGVGAVASGATLYFVWQMVPFIEELVEAMELILSAIK